MSDSNLSRIDEENEENEDLSSEISRESSYEIFGPVDPTVQSQPERVLDLTPQNARRECIVCQSLIIDSPSSIHIQPCPCGYWVHYHCLLSGIQTYEAEHPGCSPLGCKLCLNKYDISPEKGLAFRFLDRIVYRYGQFCNYGHYALSVVFLDCSFAIVGLAILMKIYGQKETEKMLLSKNPIIAVAICKAIPLVSIIINYIPWETSLLQSLRRCSALPVVGKLFPAYDPRVKEVKRRRTLFGVLFGGLLVPWFATVLGAKLCGFSEYGLFRFLLGGAAFLSLKGGLQMYYRQRLYTRQCFLSVDTYRGD